MEIRKTITDQIQTELLDLEKQALELHGIHSNKSLHNWQQKSIMMTLGYFQLFLYLTTV